MGVIEDLYSRSMPRLSHSELHAQHRDIEEEPEELTETWVPSGRNHIGTISSPSFPIVNGSTGFVRP